jgi:hypothetical protein
MKSKQVKAETTAATKNTTVPDNLEQQIKVKMQATPLATSETGKRLQITKPRLQYCKPMSSNVKLEYLVTAKQELAQQNTHKIDQTTNSDPDLCK